MRNRPNGRCAFDECRLRRHQGGATRRRLPRKPSATGSASWRATILGKSVAKGDLRAVERQNRRPGRDMALAAVTGAPGGLWRWLGSRPSARTPMVIAPNDTIAAGPAVAGGTSRFVIWTAAVGTNGQQRPERCRKVY